MNQEAFRTVIPPYSHPTAFAPATRSWRIRSSNAIRCSRIDESFFIFKRLNCFWTRLCVPKDFVANVFSRLVQCPHNFFSRVTSRQSFISEESDHLVFKASCLLAREGPPSTYGLLPLLPDTRLHGKTSLASSSPELRNSVHRCLCTGPVHNPLEISVNKMYSSFTFT